eukprot:6270354-Prymnesium_polylepis.1
MAASGPSNDGALDVSVMGRRAATHLVGPSQRRDVQNHLLAHVVVHAEQLCLVEAGGCDLVELVERLRVATKRLLDHQP